MAYCCAPLVASQFISECADSALLAELWVTPKPGLVDRRNCGAHRDMNFDTFLRSGRVLSKYFPWFVEIGSRGGDVLKRARAAGVLCEREMFDETRGVNTHKGAIFSLGLLCAACGRLASDGMALRRERICGEVARICAGIVGRERERIAAFRRFGLTGARGEASSGFWTVRSAALPAYDRLRRAGIGEEMALLQSLLHLMAVNADTNLVSRGGAAGLHYVRDYARRLLRDRGVLASDGLERLAAFDDALIARHLSPGGSADLLAVTAFLARFPE